LKESYIKAIGLGLGFELRRGSFFYPDAKSKLYAQVSGIVKSCPIKETHLLSVICCDLCIQVKIDGVLDHDWHFVLTELDDNHCVSTATRDKRKYFLINKYKQQHFYMRFVFHSQYRQLAFPRT